MADDILVSSDDENGRSSSDDDAESMLEIPDTQTYRFPTEIFVHEDDTPEARNGTRKLRKFF